MIYALLLEKLIELTITLALLNHHIIAEAKMLQFNENGAGIDNVLNSTTTPQIGQDFAKEPILTSSSTPQFNPILDIGEIIEFPGENPVYSSCITTVRLLGLKY